MDRKPHPIAARYLELVRLAPGPVAVWSRVDGAKLHLYTVLDEAMAGEVAVYEAERAVLQQFEPELVEFHVYPDTGVLKTFMHDLTPLLQPFDAFRG